MSLIPNINDIQNCNRATVYLKAALERPVTIYGNMKQVSDDSENVIIQTTEQYAIFKSSEVAAVHFMHVS